ncbi:serine hydrolase [Cyanobium sp. ULC082]
MVIRQLQLAARASEHPSEHPGWLAQPARRVLGNGAVAISYVATLLLQLVDENKVSLNDKLSRWLPDIPNADRVTLGQLARLTSGYRGAIQTTNIHDMATSAEAIGMGPWLARSWREMPRERRKGRRKKKQEVCCGEGRMATLPGSVRQGR